MTPTYQTGATAIYEALGFSRFSIVYGLEMLLRTAKVTIPKPLRPHGHCLPIKQQERTCLCDWRRVDVDAELALIILPTSGQRI